MTGPCSRTDTPSDDAEWERGLYHKIKKKKIYFTIKLFSDFQITYSCHRWKTLLNVLLIFSQKCSNTVMVIPTVYSQEVFLPPSLFWNNSKLKIIAFKSHQSLHVVRKRTTQTHNRCAVTPTTHCKLSLMCLRQDTTSHFTGTSTLCDPHTCLILSECYTSVSSPREKKKC